MYVCTYACMYLHMHKCMYSSIHSVMKRSISSPNLLIHPQTIVHICTRTATACCVPCSVHTLCCRPRTAGRCRWRYHRRSGRWPAAATVAAHRVHSQFHLYTQTAAMHCDTQCTWSVSPLHTDSRNAYWHCDTVYMVSVTSTHRQRRCTVTQCTWSVSPLHTDSGDAL